jgi:hypothetical protein
LTHADGVVAGSRGGIRKRRAKRQPKSKPLRDQAVLLDFGPCCRLKLLRQLKK